MHHRSTTDTRSLNPNQLLFSKYDPVFNFFFSKSINDMVEFVPTPELFALREYCYRDSEGEFLKRYYEIDQVPERVVLLAQIHHPPQTWPVEVPTLAHHVPRAFISKRLKRHKKLRQQLQQIEQQQRVELSSCFLDSAHNPDDDHHHNNNQARQDPRSQQSFDQIVHDIYDVTDEEMSEASQNDELNANRLARLVSPTHLEQDSEVNQEWANEEGLSHLICDFDDMDIVSTLNQYAKLKKKEKQRQGLRELNREHKAASLIQANNKTGAQLPIPPATIQNHSNRQMRRSNIFPGQSPKLRIAIQEQVPYRRIPTSPQRANSKFTELLYNKQPIKKQYPPLPGASSRQPGSLLEKEPSQRKLSFVSKELYEKLARHDEKRKVSSPSTYRVQLQRLRMDIQNNINSRSPENYAAVGSPTCNNLLQTFTSEFIRLDRSPEFDRIRKKAMELIQQQRTIPYVGSPQINSSGNTSKPKPNPRVGSPSIHLNSRPSG